MSYSGYYVFLHTAENIIEHFRGPKEPIASVRVNEKLDNGESISDGAVMELLVKRIREFDVLHRGYVLEGFPLVTSDDQPVSSQLEVLGKLAIPPDYLLIMQMQDKDLYKRRVNQKFDPETGKVYIKQQYAKFDPDELVLHRHVHRHSTTNEQTQEQQIRQSQDKMRQSTGTFATSQDNPVTEEASDTERRTGTGVNTKGMMSRGSTPEHGELLMNEVDFPKLNPDVLERLFYRTEDFNVIVSDDLESFRYNFQDLQEYVNGFDKRKVVELDSYWAPTVIFNVIKSI